MKDNPVPTRAETSDVANAVLDGASATMLSAESASGKYPEIAVKTMAHIITTVEEQQNTIEIVKGDEAAIYFKNHSATGDNTSRMIASACRLARDTKASAILCLTQSGETAYKLSSHRPKANLFVFTSNRQLQTTLGLLWGAKIIYYDGEVKSVELMIKNFIDILVKEGSMKKDDVFITTLGMPANKGLKTNTVQIGVVE
jgi:pyruvate kinase